MAIELPAAIAAYFAADQKGDAQALAQCFAPSAIAIDEGNTYEGREAIQDWIAHASTEYSYTVEPFAVTDEDDRTVVTSHLLGNFPGSPVDLRYRFVIEEDQIAQLEIVP